MGFEVNFNKPIIKETQSLQDGGAGNLGYFEQEEEKKKKDRDKSIFEAKESDTFEKDGQEFSNDEDFSISKLIAQIILAIKYWFKKKFNLK